MAANVTLDAFLTGVAQLGTVHTTHRRRRLRAGAGSGAVGQRKAEVLGHAGDSTTVRRLAGETGGMPYKLELAAAHVYGSSVCAHVNNSERDI